MQPDFTDFAPRLGLKTSPRYSHALAPPRAIGSSTPIREWQREEEGKEGQKAEEGSAKKAGKEGGKAGCEEEAKEGFQESKEGFAKESRKEAAKGKEGRKKESQKAGEEETFKKEGKKAVG
jgi:hypothetical protein